MKNIGKLLSAVCAATVLTGVSSARAVVIVDGGDPVMTRTWTIGVPESDNRAQTPTPGALYSNDTNFSGYAIYAGGSGTTKYTGMLADDITTTSTGSFTLAQFSWSIANGATVAQTISPYIRFFDTTGAGGGPGALLGGLNFNGISVAAGNVAGFYYNATASNIVLPPTFWACEFFSTTGSAANAEKIGQGTFNPVDVGSSQDLDFTSSSVGTSSSSFTTANPAGTANTSPFAGAPVANFEWEINAVPEASSLGLLAPLGLLMGGRRRA